MNFNEAKQQSGTVLIEFYASWCPHCQKMMPVVEIVRKELSGQVPVYQYDIDKNTKDADEAKIQTIPTFIIYRNGREMWRYSGEIEGTKLLEEVKNILNQK